MAMSELRERAGCVCQGCGAALEVRVGFRGKVVWTLRPENPDFGSALPQLRGLYQDPNLVCSADALHPTGFELVDGKVVVES